jgi:hypothetical protein
MKWYLDELMAEMRNSKNPMPARTPWLTNFAP